MCTGLPNRRLLTDRLGQGMMRSEHSGKLLAVCSLDLDGFKQINDCFGSASGDAMLIGVAEHLKMALRGDDTLARMGGDEFALLLSDIESPEHCSYVLDQLLRAANRPVNIQDTKLAVTASIGVSLYPDDHGDPDALLRHADQAMYLAKQAGKNRFHLYDPERDRKAQSRRNQLERLRAALDGNQFTLYYQPKVDLRLGTMVGVEALLRWQDPVHGMLAPGEFLPMVIDSDLEQPLGVWVINQAIAQATAWLVEGLDIRVSINVSANQLLYGNFPAILCEALERYPALPAKNIELEILENAAFSDLDQAIDVLAQCERMGVHFALDDFGTGYSSLTYLRKLPIQALKIDQSFVRKMTTDSEDRGIVESVIQLAHTFQLEVVAEGVETQQHAALMQNIGCSIVQGYGIARPMPADDIPAWAKHWNQGIR
ncbi:bifunctional diguanylate cyclase/phosphodiesterase [Pseudomonas nicosulfuronedens]|uniref:Bifunctional diguanylate cyclase/phosphodiesterase n=1 Tax=Pseudomonas nicosulfuronedens TaxID=2571105 RepID=A0A5R9QKN7_9PSED|nr:bifunctional diguanylate cyclase/phosphodiesterase [Pseudomonas nicosulfuronedens]TLX69921.1 bifunctional diguanylate cyclase/phosphodiesterase [Pseudomonas nicosulfuronedens]